MPIEIKELHIRVTVNALGGQSESPQKITVGNTLSGKTSDSEKEVIVAECVEQVLEIMQNKLER